MNHANGHAQSRASTEMGSADQPLRTSAALRMTAEDLGLPDRVECPFCEKSDTELHSGFGSQLSVATYWCRQCFTAFEWIKWQNR